MRLFLKVLTLQMKILIQYRTTNMLSLIGEPISFLITAVFFSRIYAYNRADVMLGYSLSQMVWYFAGLTLMWYWVWNDTDSRISNKILTGDLAVDLLKPVSIFEFELAHAVGIKIQTLFVEFLPSVFIFSLIFFPDFLTLQSIFKFLAVSVLAFLLYFLISYLNGLAAFFIKSNYSLQSIKFALISLMAGAYIPLEFFPEWLAKITRFLPFEYIFYWPIQLLLNREGIKANGIFLQIFFTQLGWVIGLYILTCFFWRRAIQKFCAIGG